MIIVYIAGAVLFLLLLASICGWSYSTARRMQMLGDLTLSSTPEGIAQAADALYEANHEFPPSYYADLVIGSAIEHRFPQFNVVVSKVMQGKAKVLFYISNTINAVGCCDVTINSDENADLDDLTFTLHLGGYMPIKHQVYKK